MAPKLSDPLDYNLHINNAISEHFRAPYEITTMLCPRGKFEIPKRSLGESEPICVWVSAWILPWSLRRFPSV